MNQQIFLEEHWKRPCPRTRCRKPAVGLAYALIPASLGDDTAFPPEKGAYANTIVKYEANGAVYIYSAEGIPVNVKEGD